MAGSLEGLLDASAQVLVLDQAPDVRVGPGRLCRLARLVTLRALCCHRQPLLFRSTFHGAYTRYSSFIDAWLKRRIQRFFDAVDVDELEPTALGLGDLGDVALVALRHDHALDPGPLGCQGLLLQTSDWQDLPGQRDLTRHRDVGIHG